MKLKLQKKYKKLKSKFIFDKKQAKKFTKIHYYQAQAKNMKAYEFLMKEKRRLNTPKWSTVTKIIDLYKNQGLTGWTSRSGKILTGIYNKNKEAAILIKKGLTPSEIINSDLLSIVSSPETLLLAYRAIKGNKGAMTKASDISTQQFNTMTQEQKELYFRSKIFPDKFSLRDVIKVSNLLKTGLYPWGSSLRIYFTKPGTKDKKRPITIPPFLDRIIQKAICMVLEAIYEPYFEAQNRSFGFRPNKGTQDAITAVTSTYSSGKTIAIEGDIEAAYDTVNKETLIQILSKKIKDRKFLKLIKDRLDYDFVEKTETGEKRFSPPQGIPQGGIDSPYLFNIYMKELDDFIHTDIQQFIDEQNNTLKKNPKTNKPVRRVKYAQNVATNTQKKLAKQRKVIKQIIQDNRLDTSDKAKKIIEESRIELYNNIKETRLTRHKMLQFKSEHPHSRELKILYVRYADDWILLTNANRQIAEIIKERISAFLLRNLGLRLSPNKTTITNITKTPARFLGFELKHPKFNKLVRTPITTDIPLKKIKGQKYILQRQKGSTIVWATVDKQRLISRFHMKGFCSESGFPKELPWLSTMEPQVIIERYNACIRGLAQFYYGFIRNQSDLQRWIYILRYSCLKTLAQKYRTTIGGIFKKYGSNQTSNSYKTVTFKVNLKINKDIYEKNWTLLSYKSVMKLLKGKNRKPELVDKFWNIENKHDLGNYPTKVGQVPGITTDSYLQQISWVSLRTQASFDMPCANCGTEFRVEQHHVRHIRKTAYELISKHLTYKQVMALRNRKQIPLCATCHNKLVHDGKYSGMALINLVPNKLLDNRILHTECFIKPGIQYNSASLEEKGWKKVNKDWEESPSTGTTQRNQLEDNNFNETDFILHEDKLN